MARARRNDILEADSEVAVSTSSCLSLECGDRSVVQLPVFTFSGEQVMGIYGNITSLFTRRYYLCILTNFEISRSTITDGIWKANRGINRRYDARCSFKYSHVILRQANILEYE